MKWSLLIFRFAMAIPFAMLVFMFSSCDDNLALEAPVSIQVSQGNYMGVVHLDWEADPKANYNIERRGPDGVWLDAGSVSEPPFDDYGFNLQDNKIVPGTHYTYRIKSVSPDIDDSQFSAVTEEGWAYELKPIDLTITAENNQITIAWDDPNCQLENFLYYHYKIVQIGPDGSTESLLYLTDHLTKDNGQYSFFTTNAQYDYASTYKVYATYVYTYKDMDNTGERGSCISETGPTVIAGGGNGGTTSSYQWFNLGSMGATNNGISFVKAKVYENIFYTAVLDNPSQGKPLLFEFAGSGFTNISGTYPAGLQNNFDAVDFAVLSGTKFLAGISDSAYFYSYNGTWSGNLASQNFGYSVKPQMLAVETNGQELLAAIYTDDNNLVIKKWNHDTVWDDNATIENSDAITELAMKLLNGTVYLYYLKANQGYNATLVIRHYNGSSWVTDLEWSRDYLMNIDLASDTNSTLYFSSESQDLDSWIGSVFKVTSTSTAESIMGNSDEWVTIPSAIAINNANAVMVCYTQVVSATQINPALAVFENNAWYQVSGDFSSGVFPATIRNIGQDFYFVYGDAQNITSSYYPISLNASKLMKK